MADKERLIDAEILKKYCLIEGDGDDEFTEGYNAAIVDVRGYVDNMPTIEAEPDKADWVQRGWEYFCSHCGGKAPMDINRKHTVTTKFCPHCGYKMGG